MVKQHPERVSGLQLWQWRHQAKQAAIASHVPLVEVDWLLQELAGLDRLALFLESFKDWPKVDLKLSLAELDQLWQKRLTERLPVQYIAKTTPWRHFQLTVSNAVLIPRPETECLIDLAVAETEGKEYLQTGLWADLGTGSGAIALGLADAFEQATIHAVDFSTAALDIAQTNAENLGLAERINFVKGSWWEPLQFGKGQFSGMVSNPPYIPTDVLPTLQPEVFHHEPHLALDGGADGLDCLRYLIDTSPSYLRSGGLWLVEMMAGQAEIIRKLLEDNGNYGHIEIHADLAGIERFALAYKK